MVHRSAHLAHSRRDHDSDRHPAGITPAERRTPVEVLRLDVLAGVLRRVHHRDDRDQHPPAARPGVPPDRRRGALPVHVIHRRSLLGCIDLWRRESHPRGRRREDHRVLDVLHRHRVEAHHGRGLASWPGVLQHLLQAQRRRRARTGGGQAADRQRPARRLREHRRPRRGRSSRRGQGRGLLVEGSAGLLHLHRMRPLPVSVPGLAHGQAAVAEAARHGPPKPRVRQGSVPARGRRQGHDGRRTGEPRAAGERTGTGVGRGRTSAGRRDRRRPGVAVGGRRHRPRRPVVLHHLRRVRRAMSRRHRTRRPHPRPAPLPDPHRNRVPERAQRHVQESGEVRQSVGHECLQADGLGQGPAVRRQTSRRRRGVAGRGRLAVLDRLCGCLRGPGQEDHTGGRRAIAHRGRLVRGARRWGDLYR